MIDPETKTRIPALEFLFSFEPSGQDAVVIRPLYLNLQRSSARTGKKAGAVDLNMSIAVTTTQEDKQQEQLTVNLLTQQEFSFKGVKFGEAWGSDKFKDKYDTAIIPRRPGPMSATVAVAVTETGSGADDYGAFKKSLDSNQAAIRDALGSALKAHIKDD